MLRKFAVQPPPIDLEMYEQLLRVGIDHLQTWMRLDDQRLWTIPSGEVLEMDRFDETYVRRRSAAVVGLYVLWPSEVALLWTVRILFYMPMNCWSGH